MRSLGVRSLLESGSQGSGSSSLSQGINKSAVFWEGHVVVVVFVVHRAGGACEKWPATELENA